LNAVTQRVSVTRTAKNLLARDRGLHWMYGEGLGNTLIIYTLENLASWCMAFAKRDCRYRSNDKRRPPYLREDEAKAREQADAMMRDPKQTQHHPTYVQKALAWRDGDFEKLAQLHAADQPF
jgi:hypothetical protein